MAATRPDQVPERGSFWKRLGWFVAIWVLSVAALGLVAYGIRLMIL